MVQQGLPLEAGTVDVLRGRLGDVADQVVAAIAVEVSEYADQLTGAFGDGVERAVQLALGGFLRLAEQSGHPEASDASTPIAPVLDAAYALGRGEAKAGRTMAGLLAAYRVGARVSWREWSTTSVELGMAPGTLAQFAELVFSYIDELSAASVTGHSDQLAVTGRVREQYRERLALALVHGEPPERVASLAERAEWDPPEALTAVIVRASESRALQSRLGPSTLVLAGDLVGLPGDPELIALLAPGTDRRAVLVALRSSAAVVGPTRPWLAVGASVERGRRLVQRHGLTRQVIDTEEHLLELVLCADEGALRDLRERALLPLSGLRPETAARLAETLRSWLLHQGRREAVAADLVVHPQTVRYRMTQLRELFGEALTQPDDVLALTVALALNPAAVRAGPATS
jgi:hypothetical protein